MRYPSIAKAVAEFGGPLVGFFTGAPWAGWREALPGALSPPRLLRVLPHMTDRQPTPRRHPHPNIAISAQPSNPISFQSTPRPVAPRNHRDTPLDHNFPAFGKFMLVHCRGAPDRLHSDVLHSPIGSARLVRSSSVLLSLLAAVLAFAVLPSAPSVQAQAAALHPADPRRHRERRVRDVVDRLRQRRRQSRLQRRLPLPGRGRAARRPRRGHRRPLPPEDGRAWSGSPTSPRPPIPRSSSTSTAGAGRAAATSSIA